MIKTKKKPRPADKNLVESWNSVQGSRIDLDKGVVRGVKVLGENSKHGYTYSQAAMKKAVPLYEGVRVNIDHPSKVDTGRGSRSYADRFGRLKNVNYVEGKGVFGDLHYNKNHALARQFEYDVEHDPKNLGLSHNARGDFGRGNKAIVESITSVTSVDLVADPATNAGLFESDKTVRKVRARQRAKWEKVMESLGMELGETPTPREAIAKLLEAIMLDGSLTPEQRKEKIMKCLEMDVADNPSKHTRVEESERMKPTKKAPVDKTAQRALKEAAKLRKELDTRKRKDRVRALCESMKFSPSAVQLKAIAASDSKTEAKQLIEAFMGAKKSANKNDVSNKPKSKEASDGPSKKLTEAEVDQFLEGILE